MLVRQITIYTPSIKVSVSKFVPSKFFQLQFQAFDSWQLKLDSPKLPKVSQNFESSLHRNLFSSATCNFLMVSINNFLLPKRLFIGTIYSEKVSSGPEWTKKIVNEFFLQKFNWKFPQNHRRHPNHQNHCFFTCMSTSSDMPLVFVQCRPHRLKFQIIFFCSIHCDRFFEGNPRDIFA